MRLDRGQCADRRGSAGRRLAAANQKSTLAAAWSVKMRPLCRRISPACPAGVSRRSLVGGAAALVALGACGRAGSKPDSADTGTGFVGGEGWIALPLAEYPELADRGGTIVLDRPEMFLYANVIHGDDGVFSTVWRICSHGACDTEWLPDEEVLECPCHGSQFDREGAVIEGPATEPLTTFQTELHGETVWVYRPV